MKHSIIIIAVATLFIFLTNFALASDVDDVKKIIQNLCKAVNDADAQAYAECFFPEVSAFPLNGGLLEFWFSGATTSQDIQNIMQAEINAGAKWDLTNHHLDVKVYGNSAVATFYDSGTRIRENGDVIQGIFRLTAVCIKEAVKWKIVHAHQSPLQTEQ